MNLFKRVIITSASLWLMTNCHSEVTRQNPVEVGTVKWERDYNTASKMARETGRPIFLLFQEVPGCSGCQQFGKDVLSDAAVVMEIEKNFIPLLIHNNNSGPDAAVLKHFGEPAWNFQVVRFINADGQDLIPRKDHVWDAPQLTKRMREALAKHTPVKLVSQATQRVAFSQFCFWQGEATLGAMDGVLRTEAGFIDGREVTLVDYNPKEISLKTLTAQAKAAGVATAVYTELNGYQKAPQSDQKRQLQGTKYTRESLTPEQATKVNAFIRTQPEKADQFLQHH